MCYVLGCGNRCSRAALPVCPACLHGARSAEAPMLADQALQVAKCKTVMTLMKSLAHSVV